MSYSIEGNKIFCRNHVMQGDGFAMAIKVTDGMCFGEPGKTTYEIDIDDPLSGSITFQSFAQLREFSELLDTFCHTEQNVLVGRDYERFMVEQVKKLRLYRKEEHRRKKKRRRSRRNHKP